MEDSAADATAGGTETRILRRPSRLGDEVYNAIYAQLMSHKIPPGGRISVDNLVRELGVSQTPIREALSRLEAQKLVVKTHLIGFSAANQMDKKRFLQLYELRSLLEPFAAERAATNMSDSELSTLERVAEAMSEATGENNRAAYGKFAQRDGEFHNLIAKGSGNELVHETLSQMQIHIHLFRLFHHPHATSDAIEEHAHILEALKKRDAKAAGTAMKRHIQRSRERFEQVFD